MEAGNIMRARLGLLRSKEHPAPRPNDMNDKPTRAWQDRRTILLQECFTKHLALVRKGSTHRAAMRYLRRKYKGRSLGRGTGKYLRLSESHYWRLFYQWVPTQRRGALEMRYRRVRHRAPPQYILTMTAHLAILKAWTCKEAYRYLRRIYPGFQCHYNTFRRAWPRALQNLIQDLRDKIRDKDIAERIFLDAERKLRERQEEALAKWEKSLEQHGIWMKG